MLKQEGLPAQLISEQKGFQLRNLLEIRVFTHYIFKAILDDSGLIPEDGWNLQKKS